MNDAGARAWPTTADGTTDWERVFEDPSDGLIVLACRSETPDQLKTMTLIILRQLFKRKNDDQGDDKRTRRCFKFRIGNGTNKPVSDLHFDGKGMSMTSSSVGSDTGVKGWSPYNVPGGDGFWFGADKGTKPLPPNEGLGPFEFCTESSPKGIDIWFSHPDGSRTRLDPNNIRTRRGRARQRNGKTLLPPDTTEAVYDIEITADGGGLRYRDHGGRGRFRVDGRSQRRAVEARYSGRLKDHKRRGTQQ